MNGTLRSWCASLVATELLARRDIFSSVAKRNRAPTVVLYTQHAPTPAFGSLAGRSCILLLWKYSSELLNSGKLWENGQVRDLAPQPVPQTVTRQATRLPDTPGTESSLKFIPPLILDSLSMTRVPAGCAKCRARRLGC